MCQFHKKRLRTGKNEPPRKFKNLRKRVQSGVKLIISEDFKGHFEKYFGDSRQTYRFLNFITEVRTVSENNSSAKDKSGDGNLSKAKIATAFNDYFVEIVENFNSRLLEVDEPSMCQVSYSQTIPYFASLYNLKRLRSFENHNEFCE